ncbi:hypothetical protein SNE40_014395 [Patella caerulea]|uniref:Uncharacterized protein n=1 Tax=Patella caerulea TaxID=87958 RepID=A0AAN8JI44_PATCE
MSGKAVQRALRGYLLVDQYLTNQIISKIIESEPGFESIIAKVEQLYCQADGGDIDITQVITSDYMDKFVNTITSRKAESSDNSKMSKLWLNYMRMLGIARKLIEADRTGSWEMHLHAVSDCLPVFAAAGNPNYLKSAYLYLQKTRALEVENPEVF